MRNDKRRHNPVHLLAAAMFACLPFLAACESAFEAEAHRTYPPEGRLVEVADGRRIQIDCRGTGGPTVIFQSGAYGPSASPQGFLGHPPPTEVLV